MMAVFHVAGIVRVNLFLDVIRNRGDWQNLIARFGQSGFQCVSTPVQTFTTAQGPGSEGSAR